MRKTISQYIDYIKLMLGVVDDNKESLEFLNKDLANYVNIAFSEVLPYISVRDRVTLPWNGQAGGAIDFKAHDIRAKSVTAVKRGTDQGYLNEYGRSLYGTWYGTYYMPYSGLLPDYDPWSAEKLMLKGLNETAGDGHFLFDYGKQLLFIHYNERLPKSVTIDYIPEYRSAEDISDDYWTMLLQKKALAITKLALSQYRGKFSDVEGAPFKLDYNRLQVEGEQLNQEIQEILEENLLNYRFD